MNSFRLLKDRSRQLDKELTGKSSVGMIGVLVTVRAKGQRKRPIMSKIPTRLTEKQFAEHIDPYLSKAKRGFTCQIPRYKVFNYILYWLHTGCQWAEIPTVSVAGSEKKKLATVPSTSTFRTGVTMAV
jgi:hypothetical protein